MLRSECHEAKETWDWEGKKEEGVNIFNSSSLGGPLSLNTHTHTHTHPGQTADFEKTGLPAV